MNNESDAEKHSGKFAIKHAGLIVIPRVGKRKRPFDSAQDAARWAEGNYEHRGTEA